MLQPQRLGGLPALGRIKYLIIYHKLDSENGKWAWMFSELSRPGLYWARTVIHDDRPEESKNAQPVVLFSATPCTTFKMMLAISHVDHF